MSQKLEPITIDMIKKAPPWKRWELWDNYYKWQKKMRKQNKLELLRPKNLMYSRNYRKKQLFSTAIWINSKEILTIDYRVMGRKNGFKEFMFTRLKL